MVKILKSLILISLLFMSLLMACEYQNGSELTSLATPNVFVAAHDATPTEKATALASGGAICDQLNDEVQIKAALINASGGAVTLSSGMFSIDNNMTVNESILVGQGSAGRYSYSTSGTRLDLGVNTSITIKNEGKLHHLCVTANTNTTTPAIIVEGQYNRTPNILHDLFVSQPKGSTGIGIQFLATATSNSGDKEISLSSADAIVHNFATGIEMKASRTSGSSSAYINGCRFQFTIASSDNLLVLDSDNNREIAGNIFDLELQPGYNTVDGINMSGSCDYNQVRCMIWDWTMASGQFIDFGNGCDRNFITGAPLHYPTLEDYISDTGEGNVISAQGKLQVSLTSDNFGDGHNVLSESHIGTAGESLNNKDLCYLKDDGNGSWKWFRADADAEVTAKGWLGIQISYPAPSANDTGQFMTKGYFCETSWDWDEGQPLYVSTEAGKLTQTPSLDAGNIIRIVGFAITPNIIYFNPSPDWYEYGTSGIIKINGINIE